MKKKILSIGSLLVLTGTMFYFSGCKKTVENLLSVECFTCTHTDSSTYPTDDNVCNAAGVTTATDAKEALGYTCNKN